MEKVLALFLDSLAFMPLQAGSISSIHIPWSQIIIPIVTTGFGSWITFVLTREKYSAETRKIEIEATQKLLTTYDNSIDSMSRRMGDLERHIAELQHDNLTLKIQFEECKRNLRIQVDDELD